MQLQVHRGLDVYFRNKPYSRACCDCTNKALVHCMSMESVYRLASPGTQQALDNLRCQAAEGRQACDEASPSIPLVDDDEPGSPQHRGQAGRGGAAVVAVATNCPGIATLYCPEFRC